MEFMLDSANLEHIKEAFSLGILDGLTTNPIIIQKGLNESQFQDPFFDYAKRILDLTGGKPTFFQVVSKPEEEMIRDAETIYEKLKPYGNVYVKVPIDTSQSEGDNKFAGINAIRRLKQTDIPILATAIVTPTQAYLASLAGADYVALMLRNYDNLIAESLGLVDLGETDYLDNLRVSRELSKNNRGLDSFLSGIETLDRTSRIFSNHGLATKLLIAGIRSPVQVSEALERQGVSAITLPFKLLLSLFGHEGTKRFVRDTYKAGSKQDSQYGSFLQDGK